MLSTPPAFSRHPTSAYKCAAMIHQMNQFGATESRRSGTDFHRGRRAAAAPPPGDSFAVNNTCSGLVLISNELRDDSDPAVADLAGAGLSNQVAQSVDATLHSAPKVLRAYVVLVARPPVLRQPRPRMQIARLKLKPKSLYPSSFGRQLAGPQKARIACIAYLLVRGRRVGFGGILNTCPSL